MKTTKIRNEVGMILGMVYREVTVGEQIKLKGGYRRYEVTAVNRAAGTATVQPW